jgi:hypothetical protein
VKWKGPRNSFSNEEQKIFDLFNAAEKNRGQNIVVEIVGDADDIHDPNLHEEPQNRQNDEGKRISTFY